ncbi:MAG: glycosyltransferase [Luteitalea sp.]|nr:glycosyltransferase [Luteitalea sp.]
MKLRVCYFGTFESHYDRNRILIRGLRELGADVSICHSAVLEHMRHKTGVLNRPGALAKMAGRMARAYADLARRYMKMPDHDVMIVGYLGHLDAIIGSVLARRRGKPLVFDAFISLYDTLTQDRGMFSRGRLPAKALWWLDKVACARADAVVLDTRAHAEYFGREFGVPASKLHCVRVGADDSVFHPRPELAEGRERQGRPELSGRVAEPFTVFHYSKFAPLHGVEYILEAARELAGEPDVRFLLVGGGQLEEQIDASIRELRLSNVDRIDWLSTEELCRRIGEAGCCLGIFGGSEKASRVVPNKIYQCMAAGGAIVTGDTRPTREVLTHGHDAWLCPVADGRALARAIRTLRDDPGLRLRLARNAVETFQAVATPRRVAAELISVFEGLIHRGNDSGAPCSERVRR